jgi:hypothetical protein
MNERASARGGAATTYPSDRRVDRDKMSELDGRFKVEWETARSHTVSVFTSELLAMDRISAIVFDFMTRGKYTVSESGELNWGVLQLVMALLTKAFKTHQAIAAVVRQGLGDDATHLVRSLYESTMPIEFIMEKDSFQRSLMYQAHSQTQHLKALRERKKTKGLQPISDETIAEAVAFLKRFTDALPAGVKIDGHWSGHGNIADFHINTGRAKAYQIFYRHASRISHANDAGDHISVGPTGVPSLHLLPGDKYLREALISAPALLLVAAKRINSRFGLGHDARFVEADQLLNSAIPRESEDSEA